MNKPIWQQAAGDNEGKNHAKLCLERNVIPGRFRLRQILAGIAVYERQAYHLIGSVDNFVSTLNLGEVHDVELHGSAMANGKKADNATWVDRDRQVEL